MRVVVTIRITRPMLSTQTNISIFLQRFLLNHLSGNCFQCAEDISVHVQTNDPDLCLRRNVFRWIRRDGTGGNRMKKGERKRHGRKGTDHPPKPPIGGGDKADRAE